MRRYIVAPVAEEDVFNIWLYLLREADRTTADRIENEILETFQALAKTPGKGHRRPDLTRQDIYFYALYQYLVVYRIGTPLEILAVLHGRRNVKRILRGRL